MKKIDELQNDSTHLHCNMEKLKANFLVQTISLTNCKF